MEVRGPPHKCTAKCEVTALFWISGYLCWFIWNTVLLGPPRGLLCAVRHSKPPRNTAKQGSEKHDHYDDCHFLCLCYIDSSLYAHTRIMPAPASGRRLRVVPMSLALRSHGGGQILASHVLMKRKQPDNNAQTAATRACLRLPPNKWQTQAHACCRRLSVLIMLLPHSLQC